jgi:hypothetical protein
MKRPKLKNIPIQYVPKDKLQPRFGQAFTNHGIVRNDLQARVKRHVALHERVHVKYGKGEIFTNFVSGFRDPIGFSATALATIKDPQRREYYLQKMRYFFNKKSKKK